MSISTSPAIDLTPDEEREVRQRVRDEQFALIFFNTNRNSSGVAFAMGLALWLYVYIRFDSQWALLWGAAIHISQLFRSFWVRRYFRSPQQAVNDPKWVRGYLLRLGINGAIWGAAPLVLFESNDTFSLAFVMIVVLAIHSGGQTWVVPVRGALLAFCLPIIGLLSLALAIHDNTGYRVAAVLSAIYLSLSIRFALQHNKLLAESLYAHFVNALLNAKLSRQIGIVEKASTEKSRFLAAASHDLRQPMHAIALFSAALEQELRGTPQHDSASRSLGAVRALSESLDAMLDVSKLDAGVVPVTLKAVSLQQVFQRLNSSFSPQASEKGLHLRFKATPLWVLSDERHLERMLSNLVSNAIKYTESGGVLVAARLRGGSIAIEVWDTGIGLPPDQTDRIFEEFYQLGNPGRDRTQGLGIGLAVVRRLSNLLGHDVHVRSVVGKGSCFKVVVRPEQVVAGPPEGSPDTAQAVNFMRPLRLPERVLVLDDEDDILAAVTRVLESYGVQVIAVSTCEQALAVLQSGDAGRRVDAFLCDLRLGEGANGLDFATSLAPRFGIHLPTILITGETGPEALQQVRQSGLQAIFKPVTANRLLEALAVSRLGAPV